MDPNELLHEYSSKILSVYVKKFDLICNITFLLNLQINITKLHKNIT